MKVLLLGATGAVGRRVAGELARADVVTHLVVSARNATTLERVARHLGGADRGVFHLELDLARDNALSEAGHGFDVIVSCAGPTHLFEEANVTAAIGAGTSYVSLCDDALAVQRILASNDRAVETGATVVTGCGLSPGLTNFMCRIAASEVDEVQSLGIQVARSTADAAGPASLRSFVRTVAGGSPPESGTPTSSATPRPSFFPDPVGWVETFGFDHPERATLPRSFPGLRSVEFRAGLAETANMDMVRAIAGLGGGNGAARGSAFTQGLLRRLLQRMPARSAPWTAARVDVEGLREGKPVTITYGIVDHLINVAALPLVQATLALGSGETAAPGVHAPDEVFGAKPFLRSLSRRGLRIARLEADRV
jgi:saccharopine dehydrogenase-like NADP-dependent oxidoreductase